MIIEGKEIKTLTEFKKFILLLSEKDRYFFQSLPEADWREETDDQVIESLFDLLQKIHPNMSTIVKFIYYFKSFKLALFDDPDNSIFNYLDTIYDSKGNEVFSIVNLRFWETQYDFMFYADKDVQI